MPKERVDRKRLLKEPDEFITTTARTMDFLRENAKWVTAAVIVVVVMGVGAWGWRLHQARNERQAYELQAQALQVFKRAAEQQDPAASGDLMGKAVDRFQTVIQRFPGTRAAWMARLYRGHACHALGRYDEALHDYEAALGDASGGDSPEMKALALEGIAYTWSSKGDLDRAVAAFQQLRDQGGSAFQGVAVWNLALLYERQGKAREALDLYQVVQQSPADATHRELARAKAAELSSREKKAP